MTTDPTWPRSVTVRLPTLPPGANNAYFNVKRGRVLSPEARTWKEAAGWFTKQAMAGVEPLRPPVRVALFAYGLSRRRDLDGVIKLAQDAVCEALGIDDRYVDEVYAVRVPGATRLDVIVAEVGREE